MRRVIAIALAWVACALAAASGARADGESLVPGGTLGVGRAGAMVANPADAMALGHNPAGLADLKDHQGYYGVDIPIDSLCVNPYGYYGWGVVLPETRPGTAPNLDVRRSEFGDPGSSAYGRRHLDYVCNSGGITPLPQLSVSLRLHERLALAFGLVAPVVVTGAQWGGADGTISVSGNGERPTPTRYTLVRQQVKFAFNPTIGAGFQALPWLSFGLGFQVGMASLDNYQVMALRAGTSPSTDMMVKIHAEDYFVPTLSFGAYAKPTRNWRIGATFVWSGGFDGSGDMRFTTNAYHAGAIDDEFTPNVNKPVKVSRVFVPSPWSATLGVRYVQPAGTEDDKHDPMRNQLWDVELDASYIASGQVGKTSAEVANDFSLQFSRANGEPQQALEVKQRDLSNLTADRHGLDVVAVRLGGSWNILPGFLQASAGAFFQSRGVQADYANIDNYGLSRIGLGLSAMMRLGPVELSVAYSHIFQETLEVAPPQHETRDQASDDPKRGFDQRIYDDGTLSDQPVKDPRAPAPSKADGTASVRQTAVFESEDSRARVINAGKYTASFNIVSVALTHRF